FGYEDFSDSLNSNLIHYLENTMTADMLFHCLFNSLQVWLEATDESNKYRIAATHTNIFLGYFQFITFMTPNQEAYPVPDPSLLSIHTSCSKIAHLSGASV
ncbi:hypothetical protein K443DRAFT_115509, partial [Laccaria amethystina LaAM-08-1]